MRNSNTKGGRSAVAAARTEEGLERLRWAWTGYHDRVSGRGFPRLYEDAKPLLQAQYELGRLWAATFLAAGKAPAWRQHDKVPNWLRPGTATYRAAEALMRDNGNTVPTGYKGG